MYFPPWRTEVEEENKNRDLAVQSNKKYGFTEQSPKLHASTLDPMKDRSVTLRKLYPLIQLITGTLLVILVVNDFVELLLEYVFNVEKLKVPIEWSSRGWKVKYWMFDHQPAWYLFQGTLMVSGFILIFTALFIPLPRNINLGIVGSLLVSALFVLLFPSITYLIDQTPREFMWYQIIAAIVVLPAALSRQYIKRIQTVGLYIAAFVMSIFLVVTLTTSIVTLIYGILPIVGILFLILTKKQSEL